MKSGSLPFRAWRKTILASLVWLGCASFNTGLAQPLVTPWGNVTGILVDGERLTFETALRAVNPDWSGFVQSSKYNWEGHPTFTLNDKTYSCTHFLQGTHVDYTAQVTDTGRGSAELELKVDLSEALPMAGAYFCVNLPASDFAGAKFELIGVQAQPLTTLTNRVGNFKELVRTKAKGFKVAGTNRSLEVVAGVDTELIVRQDFVDQPDYLNDPHPRLSFVDSDLKLKMADYQVYFEVLPANAMKGASAQANYKISASGSIDHDPVRLVLDARNPGRYFAGVGGNFRMQYPDLDPQVVDYNFKHLNIAWGRIAFPWNEWQPEESADQAEKALAGGLSPYFYAQIEMAKTLAQRRIPMILSVWVPPDWAVDHSRKIPKGVKLDEQKLQKIADSVADYLVFLKKNYGVEIALFSFNETDYGVEIQQSPEEHARANKVIGATLASRGLVTKMLLGDTGAGTLEAHKMVGATEADRTLYPFLGAISFHNYHGLTDDDLKAWAETARVINLPLLADEGGADSAAHRYPLIWTTPWFAQLETDQYIRIGAACQPLTLMPWQLNADYSLLAGGGIYGDNGPLRPTQRFWSLKQLGALSRAFWLPVTADRPNVDCAALGDIARGDYAVHIINNGASRAATLSGIPAGVSKMALYVTDGERGMQLMAVKGVVNGSVSFPLEGQTFTSLISE